MVDNHYSFIKDNLMRANNEITLTLDMAWDLCLEQWDWIKAEIEAGSKLSKALTWLLLFLSSDVDVEGLKGQWCEENGFEGVHGDCFFCEYVNQQPRIDFDSPRCDNCPGRLVDPEFYCEQSEYHYYYKPLAFHAELMRLNKIRLGLKE